MGRQIPGSCTLIINCVFGYKTLSCKELYILIYNFLIQARNYRLNRNRNSANLFSDGYEMECYSFLVE